MIPKKLHRIWFGPKPIPERYEEFWAEWQRLHPDWEFFTWREVDVPDLNLWNQSIYDVLPTRAKSCGVAMSQERATAVQRADVVAYEILYQHGGVYVNCDVRPLKRFDELLDVPAFVGLEDAHHICNAVMGSIPDHPFFNAVIRDMAGSWIRYGDTGMEVATGPQHMTRVWRAAEWELTVHPIETFYPHSYSGLKWGVDNSDYVLEFGKASDSFAVHSWGHRWQEGDHSG